MAGELAFLPLQGRAALFQAQLLLGQRGLLRRDGGHLQAQRIVHLRGAVGWRRWRHNVHLATVSGSMTGLIEWYRSSGGPELSQRTSPRCINGVCPPLAPRTRQQCELLGREDAPD